MPGSLRYANEILAWEYDQRNSTLSPGELEWYLKYYALSRGRILELACGSGRLLIPIAQAGYYIDGVDNAEAMLSRLKSKLETLSGNVRARVSFSLGDMTTFKSPTPYGMIFIGYNSLTCLETKKEIIKCFRNVNANLNEAGFFLFMIRLGDYTKYTAGEEYTIIDRLGNPLVNAQTGTSVGVRLVRTFDSSCQYRTDKQTFVISNPSGKSETVSINDRIPILSIDEYKMMLIQAGFQYQVYKGYEEKSEDDSGEYVCFVCRK